MKRKWPIIISSVILALSIATVALAAIPIKLVVNGQEVKTDVAPQVIKGRTMVPVRWVAEALGAEVQWDAKSSRLK